MRFYQHIYGRVAAGYQSDFSGYQVAALTEDLAAQPDLLQKLNRCSFFHRYEGEGNKERFSFYRPGPGILAFGCSRLVKDATGSIGSFAHNFVCEESDFLRSDVSPAALLKSLPFVKSEDEIADSRSLPMYSLTTVEEVAGCESWREFALSLADTYLGESILVVPMVVVSEAETWSLLAELFSLLPRLEVSRLTFSTLFKDATDHIDEFRLVFVPDRRSVPRDANVYRVIEPGPQRQADVATGRSVPLTAFWRAASEEGPALVCLTDQLRRADEEPELMEAAAELLPRLLDRGRLFREAIDSLPIPLFYFLLARSSDWLVSYADAGKDMPAEALRKTVWETATTANTHFLPVLEAALRLHQWPLSTALFEDLAALIPSHAEAMELAGKLAAAGHLARFCEAIINSERLTNSDRLLIAERLRRTSSYTGQIHLAIAAQLLRRIGDSRPEDTARNAEWLKDETRYLHDQFVIATVDLWEWSQLQPKHRPSFHLGSYQFAEVEQYQKILPATWRASRPFNLEAALRIAYHSNYREAFFAFLAQWLDSCDFTGQRQLLSTLASMYKPYGHEHQLLVDGIRRVENSYELARHYIEVLRRLPDIDLRAINELQAFDPPRSTWKRIFRN